MKSVGNLVKLFFYTRDLWKQMRELKADQKRNGDRYMCQAWYAVRSCASYCPRRWWIVSSTDNPTPAQSYPVRDLVTIFILAAIYAVAIGMIGGLTELAGYPPYLSVAICIIIDLLCLWQLYGLVKNAFKRHNLATSLQRLQTANYE